SIFAWFGSIPQLQQDASLFVLHRAQEIGEPAPRLVRIAALERLQRRDAVDSEVSPVVARFAPRADGPRPAPEIERKRPDFAGAWLAAGVAVVEAQDATLADRAPHRLELLHGFAIDVEARGIETRLLDGEAAIGGQRGDDLLDGRARRLGQHRSAPG